MTQLEAPVAPPDADPLPTHVRIAAVGAGFSGLALGMRLLEEGIDDFVILERSSDVGGTWRDNTYPGCACDVPSHLYSFSFAPNPDWSRTYSEQPEIYEYIRRTASERGVLAYVRFGHDVQGSRWNEEEQTGRSRPRPARSPRPTSSRPWGRSANRPGRRPWGSTASRARSSTRPSGTTTMTSTASASG